MKWKQSSNLGRSADMTAAKPEMFGISLIRFDHRVKSLTQVGRNSLEELRV